MVWAFVLVIGFMVVFIIGLYNSLVTLRNRYKNAFSQIDVQLKRRYDLIPNLVEVAKKYMAHERETLEAVIKARNQAAAANSVAGSNPGDAKAMQGLMGAEANLGRALGGIFALSENYPQLKADQTMAQLTEELTSTENKVSFARQAYNDATTEFNNKAESFPANLIARMFNFQTATLFEITEVKERENIRVSFA